MTTADDLRHMARQVDLWDDEDFGAPERPWVYAAMDKGALRMFATQAEATWWLSLGHLNGDAKPHMIQWIGDPFHPLVEVWVVARPDGGGPHTWFHVYDSCDEAQEVRYQLEEDDGVITSVYHCVWGKKEAERLKDEHVVQVA